MNSINPDFIEKYQLLYEEDPNSKIFAPLAEAYRKIGLLKEAYQVALKGVEKHPHFASGRVALAKLYLDEKKFEEALHHLKAATEIAPENILAQSLLAKTLMDLRRPKEALHAYKMLLFLNPQHKGAQTAVKRLESLSAEDFEDEVFVIQKLDQKLGKFNFLEKQIERQESGGTPFQQQRSLERFLSLADAFIVRNDVERAISTLEKAREVVGKHPEIDKRLLMLTQRAVELAPIEEAKPLDAKAYALRKKEVLERLLSHIDKARD